MSNQDGNESSIPLEEMERPHMRNIDKFAKPKIPYLSQRYTVAIMAFLGLFVLFGMRCNMGMAKVHFRNKFNVATESAVDSSLFWGFLFAQIPGGILAYKFPANKVFGIAIACSAFLNLFLPMFFEFPHVLICIRVLQGLVEGCTLPALHGVWRYWAPPLERSKLATIAFSGSYAGILLGIPISGYLTSKIHWKAMFFFFGILGITWYAFWYWLVFEKPRDHPAITEQEQSLIEKSLGESAKLQVPKIPWGKFFTSLPVYSIVVANFCQLWTFYLVIMYQGKFLKHKFAFRVHEDGFAAVLPYLLMIIIVPLGGFLADLLRQKKIMSTTNVRKLFNNVGFGLQGLLIFYVAYAKAASGALFAIIFGVAFSKFATSGYNVNHLDIAPRFASILMGLSNGIGTIAALICPIVTDYLITEKMNKNIWENVFIIAACIQVAGGIFYGIFASGELQSWAEPKKEEENALKAATTENK